MIKSSKKVIRSKNQSKKALVKTGNSAPFYSTLIGKNPNRIFAVMLLSLLIICLTICAIKLIETSKIIDALLTATAGLMLYLGFNKPK